MENNPDAVAWLEREGFYGTMRNNYNDDVTVVVQPMFTLKVDSDDHSLTNGDAARWPNPFYWDDLNDPDNFA